MITETRGNPVPEPHSQGQEPVIDLSFLDADPGPDGDAGRDGPLTQEQVAVLLAEAARSAGDARRVTRIQIRLIGGMQGTRCLCPCPAARREIALSRLFTDRYREGAAPGLVAELCRFMNVGQDAPAAPEKTGRAAAADAPGTCSDPLARRMTGVTIGGFDLSDVPLASEITPGLWQGGSADGMVLPRFVAHFVQLSRRKPYAVAHDLASHLAYRMTDSLAQDMSAVDPLARWVNDCRETGPVLVQCAAGLNRSGLVVARALMLRDGMSANQAIELIRARRSPACLCNQAFEDWLRGQLLEGRRDAAPADLSKVPCG